MEFLGVNENWQLMSPRQIEMSTLVFMLLGVLQSLPGKKKKQKGQKAGAAASRFYLKVCGLMFPQNGRTACD